MIFFRPPIRPVAQHGTNSDGAGACGPGHTARLQLNTPTFARTTNFYPHCLLESADAVRAADPARSLHKGKASAATGGAWPTVVSCRYGEYRANLPSYNTTLLAEANHRFFYFHASARMVTQPTQIRAGSGPTPNPSCRRTSLPRSSIMFDEHTAAGRPCD